MKFEYVASGVNHTQICTTWARQEYSIPVYKELVSLISSTGNFSFLFNAFTEEQLGEVLQDYRDCVYSIHSDSGGLQIVTLGKKVTAELYKDIYRRQAKNSDIAMSFDEIPVKRLSDKIDMNDFVSRVFDMDNYKEFAKKSGENLVEQIQLFLDEKSNTKPLLIAQGNDIETYRIWTDTLLSAIPSHLHRHIGGIAVSGASLGGGLLEDIQKAAFIAELDHNHIHLLGIGSVKRLLPLMVFNRSGLYKKEYHLSYDSTSHTSGINKGSYWIDGKSVGLGRTMGLAYEHVYSDIDKKLNLQQKGIDLKDFYATMSKRNYSKMKHSDNSFIEEEVIKFIYITMGFGASSIINFINDVDLCSSSDHQIDKFSKLYKMNRDTFSLKQISSISDFEYWLKTCANHIPSKRIKKTTETHTLDELF